MNKKQKIIVASLASLIALLVVFKVFGGKDQEGLKVTAEESAVRTIIETVSAPGRIYPEVEVTISPDISGEIIELNVQEGDSVKRGQVLARIYAEVYSSQRDEAVARVTQSQANVANSQAALESLRAQLDQAQKAYDRNTQLFDQKVISRSEFEQFETQLRTARSSYNAALQNIRSLQAQTQSARTTLDMADDNLGRTTLRAPMDGVISWMNVKKGERVVGTAQMAGTEMMRVADLGSMEVRVEVGENDIVKVSVGDEADVEVEAYNNRKFKGIVTQISSSTSNRAVSQTTTGDVTNFEVHIRLDPSTYQDLLDPGRPRYFPFRPGMNASAQIKTTTRQSVVTVPIGAVAARVKGTDKVAEEKKAKNDEEENNVVASEELEEIVFVVGADNLVQRKVVITGIQDMNYFEIRSGLKAGERIVTAPYEAVNSKLKSGDKVNIVSREELLN